MSHFFKLMRNRQDISIPLWNRPTYFSGEYCNGVRPPFKFFPSSDSSIFLSLPQIHRFELLVLATILRLSPYTTG